MYALETVQASLLILAVRAAATFSIFSTQSFHFNIYSFCHSTGNLTLKLCLHQTRVHFIIYQTFSFHLSFDKSIQPLHYIYFFLFGCLFSYLSVVVLSQLNQCKLQSERIQTHLLFTLMYNRMSQILLFYRILAACNISSNKSCLLVVINNLIPKREHETCLQSECGVEGVRAAQRDSEQ